MKSKMNTQMLKQSAVNITTRMTTEQHNKSKVTPICNKISGKTDSNSKKLATYTD